jgi:hypothetical protein
MTGSLPMGSNKITGLSDGTAATDAVAFGQLAVLLPTGIITMWSGSIATIPTGWYLCDGTNGTPNLKDRFIVGAGNTYAVSATGGSADATLPTHTHTLSSSGTTSGTSNDHSHSVSGGTSAENTGHNHNFNFAFNTTNSTTASPVNGGAMLGVTGGNTVFFTNDGTPYTNGGGSGTTGDISNNHNHTFGATSGGQSAGHTHTVTVTGTSGATGNSATNANLPPYYALAYIMKA